MEVERGVRTVVIVLDNEVIDTCCQTKIVSVKESVVVTGENYFNRTVSESTGSCTGCAKSSCIIVYIHVVSNVGRNYRDRLDGDGTALSRSVEVVVNVTVITSCYGCANGTGTGREKIHSTLESASTVVEVERGVRTVVIVLDNEVVGASCIAKLLNVEESVVVAGKNNLNAAVNESTGGCASCIKSLCIVGYGETRLEYQALSYNCATYVEFNGLILSSRVLYVNCDLCDILSDSDLSEVITNAAVDRIEGCAVKTIDHNLSTGVLCYVVVELKGVACLKVGHGPHLANSVCGSSKVLINLKCEIRESLLTCSSCGSRNNILIEISSIVNGLGSGSSSNRIISECNNSHRSNHYECQHERNNFLHKNNLLVLKFLYTNYIILFFKCQPFIEFFSYFKEFFHIDKYTEP